MYMNPKTGIGPRIRRQWGREKNPKWKTFQKKQKTMRTEPLPTTFSSLPYDLVLYCLARVSTLCRPTLSLVSKNFRSLMASPELEATGFRMGRSLMASPELEATRTRMGITETYLCVCLDLNKHYSSSHWFTLAPIPKQEKLQHNVSFPIYAISPILYCYLNWFRDLHNWRLNWWNNTIV